MDKDELKQAIVEAHHEIEQSKVEIEQTKIEMERKFWESLDDFTPHERKLIGMIAETEGCSEFEAFVLFADLAERGRSDEYLTDLKRRRDQKGCVEGCFTIGCGGMVLPVLAALALMLWL
jgi:hypothetical protein